MLPTLELEFEFESCELSILRREKRQGRAKGEGVFG